MKTFIRIAPPRNAVNVLISGVPVGWTATVTSQPGLVAYALLLIFATVAGKPGAA
jgi:hypothetical protein